MSQIILIICLDCASLVILTSSLNLVTYGLNMTHKADNDTPKLYSKSACDQHLNFKKNVRPIHQLRLFKHKDSSLQAGLYFDGETGLWIIEYMRDEQVISSALYQAESTAHLILRSHGYQETQNMAC